MSSRVLPPRPETRRLLARACTWPALASRETSRAHREGRRCHDSRDERGRRRSRRTPRRPTSRQCSSNRLSDPASHRSPRSQATRTRVSTASWRRRPCSQAHSPRQDVPGSPGRDLARQALRLSWISANSKDQAARSRMPRQHGPPARGLAFERRRRSVVQTRRCIAVDSRTESSNARCASEYRPSPASAIARTIGA